MSCAPKQNFELRSCFPPASSCQLRDYRAALALPINVELRCVRQWCKDACQPESKQSHLIQLQLFKHRFRLQMLADASPQRYLNVDRFAGDEELPAQPNPHFQLCFNAIVCG